MTSEGGDISQILTDDGRRFHVVGAAIDGETFMICCNFAFRYNVCIEHLKIIQESDKIGRVG